MPRKLRERREIQRGRRIDDAAVAALFTWDLPPASANLRRLRAAVRRS